MANRARRHIGSCLLALGLLLWGLGAQAQSLNELFLRLEIADEQEQAPLYAQIGHWYHEQGVHGKSIEYLQKAHEKGKSQFSHREHIGLLRLIGRQYEQIRDFSNAIDAYSQLRAYAHPDEMAPFLGDLARASRLQGLYEQALKFQLEWMRLLQHQDKPISHHFLGEVASLYAASGQYPLAVSYYAQASQAADSLVWKRGFLVAQAVAHVKAHELDRAQQLLDRLTASGEALRLPHAEAYQGLAFAHYSLGHFREALAAAQQALDPKMPGSQDPPLRINLYKLLKSAAEALQDYKTAFDYSQQYAALSNAYELEIKEQRQLFLQREVEAEREEGIIRDFLAQRQQQEASLVQERLEREKKERELILRDKELALLKQQQDLKNAQLAQQRLEREQIEQRLRFAEQQALAEARKREAEQEALNAKEQRLLADRAEAERIRQQKALEVVKKEKSLQDTQLEQQRDQQRYTYVFLALALAIAGLLVAGYRSSNKARRLLQAKNSEIEQRNRTLQETQLTLQAQRDAIEKQHKELEIKNLTITSSLNYAMNIQGAILPGTAHIAKHFAEHFVLYRPKDVVSGDFYWIEALPDGALVLASVDCTGHGIPGAFMSMIGHTLMNEIVLSENIRTPAAVLEELHQKVRQALHQDVTQNRDGMDCCVCLLAPPDPKGIRNATYAGARIPLYYAQPGAGAVEALQPTKRSIGGEQFTDRPFEEWSVELQPGAMLFFSTDGIVDQSSPDKKRFGKSRLQQLLGEKLAEPMDRQMAHIAAVLDAHQGEESQRDDITLLGLKL